jgi:hypothetical protein
VFCFLKKKKKQNQNKTEEIKEKPFFAFIQHMLASSHSLRNKPGLVIWKIIKCNFCDGKKRA